MNKELIKRLYEIKAIKIGQFTLKSGDISPFYIDLRLVPSYPILFDNIINEYCKIIDELSYTPSAIAGIMSAGIPFATGIALKRKIPLLQIRKTVKDYGTTRLIEGKIPEKYSKVVLIDDLISTGASKTDPINSLRELKLVVDDLVVLIDRTNKKNKNVLSSLGVNIKSSFDLINIIDTISKNNISDEEISILKNAVNKWVKVR